MRHVVVVPSGCWEWSGAKGGDGYGRFNVGKHRTKLAHRVSWGLHRGDEPPAERMVLHRCDNRRCVNPDHLFLGTARDNTHDMMRKRRGAGHFTRTLSDADVATIKAMVGPLSQSEVARRFGVFPSQVSRIVRGESYRAW